MSPEYMLAVRTLHREQQRKSLRDAPVSFVEVAPQVLSPPRMVDRVASTLALPIAQLGRWIKRSNLERTLSFSADFVLEGERWSKRAALSLLRRSLDNAKPRSALVQGCGRGVGLPEFFLRAGVPHVAACDPLPMNLIWQKVNEKYAERYHQQVDFGQSSVESLRYSDGSFDIVSSEAVYEHIHSLQLAVAETHRVLRPGGFLFHAIGPLYFTYGGDHCSGEVKFEDGFDHLFAADDTYRSTVDDDSVFSQTMDPCCNFWAKHSIFSFARAEEYVRAFDSVFSKQFLLVVVSEAARKYALDYPQRWQDLIASGYSEVDLLVKSLYLCYQRKP